MGNKFPEMKSAAVRQTGAVLVVSLIMLLVITLLGVAGMKSSLMQERMSANAQNYNRVFQAAESSVGEITAQLRNGTLSALRESMDATDSLSPVTTYVFGGNDITATYQVRYMGEIAVTSGSSMDANESATLLKGYRYELIGSGEIAGSGASSTVSKGIEYN